MKLMQYNPEQHYELLKSWWTDHNHQVVPQDMLSSLGFIVEKESTPVMCGFIYLTNSKISIFEFLISDTKLNKEDKDLAFNFLMAGVDKYTKSIGYEYCMVFLQRPKLKERYAERGFIKINENVDIMIGSL